VRPHLTAVVGARGVGKTTHILALLAPLREQGLLIGGVVQPVRYEGDRRTGYDLVDVATGDRRAFARHRPPRFDGDLCFRFDPTGWAWAAERIRAPRREADVVVVDEMGRLEARGEGHVPSLLEPLPHERARRWILAVREDLEAQILAPWGGADERIFLPAPR